MFENIKNQMRLINDYFGVINEEYELRKENNKLIKEAQEELKTATADISQQVQSQQEKLQQVMQDPAATKILSESAEKASINLAAVKEALDDVQTVDFGKGQKGIDKFNTEIGVFEKQLSSLSDKFNESLKKVAFTAGQQQAFVSGQQQRVFGAASQAFGLEVTDVSQLESIQQVLGEQLASMQDVASQVFGGAGQAKAVSPEDLQTLLEYQTAFADVSSMIKELGTLQSLSIDPQTIQETLNFSGNLADKIQQTAKGAGKTKEEFKAQRDSIAKAAGEANNLGKKISEAAKGTEILGTNLKTLAFLGIANEISKFTSQTTELAKQLGASYFVAEDLRDSFTNLLGVGDSLLMNQNNILEAQLQLNKEIGTALINQEDLVKGQVDLVKGFKLQEDVAVRIAKLAVSNRTTTKDVTKEVIEQTRTLARQRGIFFDVRSVLTEVAGLSADIRAQLGFSSEAISQAVIDSRKLGTNLSTVAKASSALLDFEKSIGAELSAQLITGKAINLNQARMFALNGDLSGVVKEIAKNMGDFETFSRLNVIQQQSLAEAFGMSAAELSSMVEERFILNELGAENLEQLEQEGRLNELLLQQGGEILYNRYLEQSAADRFQDTMRRLTGLLSDIVEGPLFALVEGFAALANTSAGMVAILGTIGTLGIASAIGTITTAVGGLASILGIAAAEAVVLTGGLALLGAGAAYLGLKGYENYKETGNIFGTEEGEEMPGSGIMNALATPIVQDAYIDSDQGPFSIASMRYGKMMPIARTTPGDNAMFSPNVQPASISSIAAQGNTTINNSYESSKMSSKLDEMISSNKAVIAAIDKNTQVSQQNAQFLAKAKQKLVVGATDLGTDLAVNSYRIQFGVWAVIMLINSFLPTI